MKGICLAPSPNWNCSKVSDCTADGLFAFGSNENIALLNLTTNPPTYTGVLYGRTLHDRVVGVRFSPSQTELVCVSEKGTVTIWNVHCRVELKQFHGHQDKVTCVDWSPLNFDLIGSGDENGTICLYMNGGVKKYEIQKSGKVSAITFSPFVQNLLAVGFRDGLILVLNALNLPAHLHALRRHEDEIQSLSWFTTGGLNELFSASSGKDATVRRWNVSEGKLVTTHNIPKFSSGHRSNKSRLWATLYWCSELETLFCSGYQGELLSMDLSKESSERHLEQQLEVLNKECPRHNGIIFNISGFGSMACTISMDRQIIVWNLAAKKSVHLVATLDIGCKAKPFKSLFLVSEHLDNDGGKSSLNDILLLADPSSIDGKDDRFGSGALTHLGCFSNRVDTFLQLKTEANYHKEHDNLEYALQLEIWKGNIGKAIELATEHNQLSEWLVALAPLGGSQSLWKKACHSFANQLIKEGETYRAILYLIAVGEVEGAINVLRTKKMYREALCLARVRLSLDDPVINKLLSEWQVESEQEGNYELAAKCCVAKGDLGSASKTLSLCCDPNSLKVAAYLAKLSGDQTNAPALAETSVMGFLDRNDWTSVSQIIDDHPTLKVFSYVAEVHRICHQLSWDMKCDDPMTELKADVNLASLSIWTPFLFQGRTFMQYIMDTWTSTDDLTEVTAPMSKLLEQTMSITGADLSNTRLKRQITVLSTGAFLSYVNKDYLSGLKYLTKTFDLFLKSGHKHTFIMHMRMLLPCGLRDLSWCLPFGVEINHREFSTAFHSIRAYYSLAILFYLIDDDYSKKDINLKDLTLERDDAEEAQMHVPLDKNAENDFNNLIVGHLISNLLGDFRLKVETFPDQMESALLLIVLCQKHNLPNWLDQVNTWTRKFTHLKEQQTQK